MLCQIISSFENTNLDKMVAPLLVLFIFLISGYLFQNSEELDYVYLM